MTGYNLKINILNEYQFVITTTVINRLNFWGFLLKRTKKQFLLAKL